jgi:hypothetical protein
MSIPKQYQSFHFRLTAVAIFVIVLFSNAITIDPCKDLVRKYFNNTNTSNVTASGKTIYLRYNTKIEMWNNEEYPNTNTDIELIAYKQQIHFISKEASFYSDEKDAFILIHRTKNIIKNKSLSNAEGNIFLQQANLFKDSLIITSKVIFCEEVKDVSGNILKKVQLQPQAKAREAYKINRLTFLLDTKEGFIRQMKIEYTEQSKVKIITNTYSVVDTNNKIKLTQPVYSKFMDSQGRLLVAYKEYSFTDNSK